MYQHQSHSWQLATHVPCMAFHTYTYPCSQEFAQPCWIGQPCWTYSCSSLDTGPCSTLLDIPLLIPAGYTIAHTGTCSALLDIPLLSLCSVLLDTDRLSPARHIRSALLPEIGPCSALLETTLQVLAQPCWTPLLSPAGNTIAQPYRCLLSPTGHSPCTALLDTGPYSALLDTGPYSALLDTGPYSALLVCSALMDTGPSLLSPAGHRPLLSPAGHRPLLSPAGLLDTGPCTALLDTGPYSALLDTALLVCSALMDTGPSLLSPAGHRPLLSPAGHRP